MQERPETPVESDETMKDTKKPAAISSAINTGSAAATTEAANTPPITVPAAQEATAAPSGVFLDQTATISVKGVEHTIVFNFGNMSPYLNAQIARLGNGATEAEAEEIMALLAACLVERWTLTDDDGEPLPVTKTGARQLSYRTMAALTSALTGGAQPETADVEAVN